jgi:hypothetical protein
MPARTTRPLLALAAALAVAASILAVAPKVSAAVRSPRSRAFAPAPSLDVRRPVASPVQLAAATARARADLGRALGREGVFQLDPHTGTPRVVARLDGFLTPPTVAPAARVAMGFVRSHLPAFGLTLSDLRTFVLLRDYVSIDGTHHLSWTQQAGGVRAFDNGLKANVTAAGQLINLSGSPAHGLGVTGPGARPSITAEAAIARARADVGAPTASVRGDTAQLVWFQGGRSRLGWQTFTNVSPDERDVSVVDAATGAVLWRANLVDAATGTGTAWEYSPSKAVTGTVADQQPVTFPVASNSKLAGNNAHVYLDANDDNVPTTSDEVASNGGFDWSVPATVDTTTTGQNCAPTHPCTWNKNVSKSWQVNRMQDAVQVYHYLNEFHDWLQKAPIGFNEAAGNFQKENASGKGEGGDAVQGQVFDGANTDRGLPDVYHYNNANFFTPPDGRAPVMQMYLFKADRYTPNWPSANAGDDASVVYHEYTHGLSSRLVTYPNGLQALNQSESGAMGEAISDWYAMDYLVGDGSGTGTPGPDPSWIVNTKAPGEVMVGKWITGGEGIRYQAIDCSVGAPAAACPAAAKTSSGGFTFGDYGKVAGSPEVHSDGEIWAQTLWDLRERLGQSLAERLITRGMELSPPEPSFLDMRNAIVQADLVADGGAHATAIWKVFAHRGMGYFASVTDGNDVTPVQNFSMPPSCKSDPCGSISGRVHNALTGAPLAGVTVSIGGLDTGFAGSNFVARTDAKGHYAIKHVPFHSYADLIVDRRAMEPLVLHGVTVKGTETVNPSLYRDWAAADGGAKIVAFTRPDYTGYGCGPVGAIDRSLVTGWGSDAPSYGGSGTTGPRSIQIQLPAGVDVLAFLIDPGATCGDTKDAGVKAFDIYTKVKGGHWVLSYSTKDAPAPGRLTKLAPRPGTTKHVRFVKLTMRSNRGNRYYMDMTELAVRGT